MADESETSCCSDDAMRYSAAVTPHSRLSYDSAHSAPRRPLFEPAPRSCPRRRFAMMNLGPDFKPSPHLPPRDELPFACRWILSRLDAAVRTADEGMEACRWAAATSVSPPRPTTPRSSGAASNPTLFVVYVSTERVPHCI